MVRRGRCCIPGEEQTTFDGITISRQRLGRGESMSHAWVGLRWHHALGVVSMVGWFFSDFLSLYRYQQYGFGLCVSASREAYAECRVWMRCWHPSRCLAN